MNLIKFLIYNVMSNQIQEATLKVQLMHAWSTNDPSNYQLLNSFQRLSGCLIKMIPTRDHFSYTLSPLCLLIKHKYISWEVILCWKSTRHFVNEHFYIDQKQTRCQSILHIKILIKNSHFINCINITFWM